MRVSGKNVFNELDLKKIRKVYLSKSFNDKNITRGSVFWHGTGGTISQSEFLTPKAVYVCDHGEVSFNRNTELSPESGNYIVYVGNNASFDSNNFNNLIYN